MSDGESDTLCPACHTRVHPEALNVVYAVEIRRLETMNGLQETDGMGRYFHLGCFTPYSADWRRLPHPE
jgi:hypothetical protein